MLAFLAADDDFIKKKHLTYDVFQLVASGGESPQAYQQHIICQPAMNCVILV